MPAIKAAVCREFEKPLAIEQVELAEAAKGEVRVALQACAICHSDIMYIDGLWGGDLPAVYGHEAAGIVESVGSGVEGVRIGDHVVVTLIRSCGDCHYCNKEQNVLCEKSFALDEDSPLSDADGAAIQHGLRTGAFAEQVVVEASQVCVIPQEVSSDVASLLACGVITGLGAVTNTAQVPAGSNVVVIGCGGVGLNTVQGAKLVGANTVIAIDITDSKLRAATAFGASHTINSSQQDACESIRSITDGRGADYVFVTVGAKAAIDQSMAYLANGGTMVVVGMPASGVMGEYDPGDFAARGQRILGSKMGSSRVNVDIPLLVECYRRGDLKLDELISGRFPLDDINDAISGVKNGSALRNVIVF
jgi:S-(hydroxymethyl)glutathione dehydrogenase/alcohol dehydrogenase